MQELIQGAVDTYYNSDFAEVKREDDAARHNTQGIAYSKNGDHARAIAALSKAVKLDPHFAQAYYNRGLVYDSKADYEKSN